MEDAVLPKGPEADRQRRAEAGAAEGAAATGFQGEGLQRDLLPFPVGPGLDAAQPRTARAAQNQKERDDPMSKSVSIGCCG